MDSQELLRRYDAGERNLERVDLSGGDLRGADLSGVISQNTTCPDGTNGDW